MGLTVELQSEIMEPHLQNHHFFVEYKQWSTSAMKQLCYSAVTVNSYAKRDLVFSVGANATNMYIMRKGTLTYHRSKGMKLPDIKYFANLNHGQWCTEHIMWVPWKH